MHLLHARFQIICEYVRFDFFFFNFIVTKDDKKIN